MTNISGLFPIPFGTTNIGRNYSEQEYDYFSSLESRPNTLNRISKNMYVFENEAMQDIAMFCHDAVNSFFQQVYCPSTPVSLRITQSWLNWANKGEAHSIHKHPNSFLSAVLYINADRDFDSIEFKKDPPDSFSVPFSMSNELNSHSFIQPVGTGDLLIFPSYLSHVVPTVQKDHERISLSFNTFFSGTFGQDYLATELSL